VASLPASVIGKKGQGGEGRFLPDECAHTPWPLKKASMTGQMWAGKPEKTKEPRRILMRERKRDYRRGED